MHWSSDPNLIAPETPLLGALFVSERKLEKTQASTVVFVLEKKGEWWERVGLCVFRGSEVRAMSEEGRKGASGAVEVEEWEGRYVSMREWLELGTAQRIMLG